MWEWLILLVFVFLLWIRIKKRKYFWKDKQGNKLSFKEFMSRWREGVSGITPLQQSFTQLLGTWIVMTGLIAGIVVTCLVRLENMWVWILIILIGSLIVTGTSLLGQYQKYRAYKRIDMEMKRLNSKTTK